MVFVFGDDDVLLIAVMSTAIAFAVLVIATMVFAIVGVATIGVMIAFAIEGVIVAVFV